MSQKKYKHTDYDELVRELELEEEIRKTEANEAHQNRNTLLTYGYTKEIEEEMQEITAIPNDIIKTCLKFYHIELYADEEYDSEYGGLDDDYLDILALKSGGPNPVTFYIDKRSAELSRFCTTILEC